ncbi:MAG: DUF6702 family protein [Ferruginibacter sp.]
MRFILYKWLFVGSIWILNTSLVTHPIYVSVTEIEYTDQEARLEVSCKMFTDDFEKALRTAYQTHIDLLKPSEKEAMNKLVSDYVEKHLQISINEQKQKLEFLGFEQIEDGIYSFYQVNDVAGIKNITVRDDILYEYQTQQVSLVHITVNGKRQSTRLTNPETKVSADF